MLKSISNTFTKSPAKIAGFFCLGLLFSLSLPSCAKQNKNKKEINIIKIDSSTLNLKQFLIQSQKSPSQIFNQQYQRGISTFTKKHIIKQFLENHILEIWSKENSINILSSKIASHTKELMQGYGDHISFKQSLYKNNVSNNAMARFIRAKLLRAQWIEKNKKKIKPISNKEIKSFLRKKKLFFKPIKVATLQHLLLKTETDAKIIHNFLIQNKTSFSHLYKILPQFNLVLAQKSIRVPEGASEVFDSVFKMKKGEISSIIKSSWGWHIYKVLKIEKNKKGLSKPFSFIKAILIEKKIDQLYQAWIKSKLKNKSVFINKKILQQL